MKLIILVLCISVAAAEKICDKKIAFQSSTSSFGDNGYAEKAVDDNKSPNPAVGEGCTHTDIEDPNPWIIVDLGCDQTVTSVSIVNRNNKPERLFGFVVTINMKLPDPDDRLYIDEVCVIREESLPAGENQLVCDRPIHGRFVMLRFTDPSEHYGTQDEALLIHVCDISIA